MCVELLQEPFTCAGHARCSVCLKPRTHKQTFLSANHSKPVVQCSSNSWQWSAAGAPSKGFQGMWARLEPCADCMQLKSALLT